MVGGGLQKSNGAGNKGPTRQRPWFRLPPKVQIVLGILGRAPSTEPRVAHLGEGKQEIIDEGRSGHRSRALSS